AVGPINFAGPNGQLIIAGTSMPTNVISGFIPNDIIDLRDVRFDPAGSVRMLPNNVLQVVENGNTYRLNFDPARNFGTEAFRLRAGTDGTTVIAADPAFGIINASLLTQGDLSRNGTTDLVWRDANAQTTVWSVDNANNVTTFNLGPIDLSWTMLGSGHYLSTTTTEMLTRHDPDGTMTLWWLNNNGVLSGINLGQHWQNIQYVATGPFTNLGATDILVRNQIDNHMYVWWVDANSHILQGIDEGAYWANISYV